MKLDHIPLHLHLERFFRLRICLLFVLGCLLLAIFKVDDIKLLNIFRQAYAQGFGMIGVYMREETTRMPVSYNIAARIPTTSASQ